jgi:hypothetical protein
MIADKPDATESWLFLRRRLITHNLLQIGCCVLLVPGSIWAWLLSYHFAHATCSYLLEQWLNVSPEPVSSLAGWAFLAILAVEGVRRGIAQWRSDEIDLADLDDETLDCLVTRGSTMTSFRPCLGFNAYWTLTIFLLAPLCVLKLIQCYGAIVWPKPATTARAAATLAQLAADRTWIPVSKLGSSRKALLLLHRLRLIWAGYRGGEPCVCIATTKSESP